MMSSERDWFIPALAMTVGLAMFVVLLAPASANYASALGLLPLWTGFAAVLTLVACLPRVFAMMRAGENRPLATIAAVASANRVKLLAIFLGFMLAGLNLIAFMWAKPLLNYLVPFWADPYLAQVDRWLFLGHRPDQLLAALNFKGMALFYHRGWFAMMVAALLYLLSRQPSPAKTALVLSYFALWTFAGPIIHTLLPAGGPIFYERLGFGTFAISGLPETNFLADYLWDIYSTSSFGPGAGISAMPSLHIATLAWVCLVAPGRWRWIAIALSLLIFCLSMSLGWHYAVDGIVGTGAAVALYRLFLLWPIMVRDRKLSAA